MQSLNLGLACVLIHASCFQAAMKAYLKDMEGNCDADLTAQKLKFEAEERQRIEEENRVKEAKAKVRETKAVRVAQEALEKTRKLNEMKRERALKKSVKTKWYEAKSEQGHTYYWHIETNGRFIRVSCSANWRFKQLRQRS